MTTNASFDDRLTAWLEEDSAHRVRDHLDEVLVLTRPMRQRAWWSSPGRWLPMDTTVRLAPVPNIRWLLVAIALLIAVGAAVAIGVGSQHRLPPPFGNARNGAVVHETNGDILSLDTATNRETTLVGGLDTDLSPRLSLDGTKIAFDRRLAAGHQIMIANADGTGVRPLGPPITEMDPIIWSPDGTRLAMDSKIAGETGVRIIDLAGKVTLVLRQDVGSPTEAVQDVQWRPDGQGLVLRAWRPGGPFGLWTVRADGTGLHRILPISDPESFRPALSPDGKTVAYSFIDEGQIRLADVDTGADRAVSFTGDGEDHVPVWSPDGSHLAFQRASGNAAHVVVGSATGGALVETGPGFSPFGGPEVAFSPDGSKLIAWYSDTNSTWLLDPAGGPGEQLSFDSSGPASWQRLAP